MKACAPARSRVQAPAQPLPDLTAVILASLLYFPAGLVLGGVLATGQAEPLRWLSVGLYLAALLAFCLRRSGKRRRWCYGAAALCSGLAVLIFCGVAGRYWPWSHGLMLGVANFVLLALVDCLFRIRRAGSFVLAAMLVAGMLIPARAYLWPLNSPVPSLRPPLVIMTSLPIAPMQGRAIGDILRGEDGLNPVAALLSRHFQLRFIDFLSRDTLAGAKQLLLAHPRAMQPRELVALDDWVRGGGKVVILADPLLAWPSSFPLGDPRNPPVTSLLDPLLAHWGLELEPVRDGPVRKVLLNRRLLVTAGASRFSITSRTCATQADGLIARCHLASGTALVIADADLLNPARWMKGNRPDNLEINRTADNMQLLLQWLGVPQSHLAPPLAWIFSVNAMASGFAAALLPLLLLLFLPAAHGIIWNNARDR